MSPPLRMTVTSRLDRLLPGFRAQPVGSGYLDILVRHDDALAFADAVPDLGDELEALTWREYLENPAVPARFPWGGPLSRWFPGCFVEICSEWEPVPAELGLGQQRAWVHRCLATRQITAPTGEVLRFTTWPALTPGFWLKVDDFG